VNWIRLKLASSTCERLLIARVFQQNVPSRENAGQHPVNHFLLTNDCLPDLVTAAIEPITRAVDRPVQITVRVF